MTEVTIYGGGGMEQYPYLFDEKYRNKFFTQSNFYGGGTRAVHPYGQVSLIPMHLHACYTRYNEVWKPNVIATSATPMDKHGYFNLSLGGWEKKFLDTADVVILEIVDDMPNICLLYTSFPVKPFAELCPDKIKGILDVEMSMPPQLLEDVAAATKGAIPIDTCLTSYGVITVSYTHLDVYKRQGHRMQGMQGEYRGNSKTNTKGRGGRLKALRLSLIRI